jgi:solute carrier family 35 (UDP-galactose transporter), member B1
MQEELLADKKKKLDTNFILGIQNIIAIALSASIISFFDLGSLFGEFHKGDGVIGVLNFCTSYCSNFSLKFVHYPVMALAKSAKILPVALTGWLLGVYKLTWTQTALFIMITSGLVVFNFNKEKSPNIEDESLFGLTLVGISLLFDGFVNAETDKNHKAMHRPFAYHSMFYTMIIALIGNICFYTYHVANGDNTYARVLADPVLTRNVFLLSLSGALGQIFIYLTISLHDCLLLSVFTTSRKCLSVILSSIIFQHSFTMLQWLGALMVLGGTVLEVYIKHATPQKKKTH